MSYELISVMLIPSGNNQWELISENYQEFGTITVDNNMYIGTTEIGGSTRGTLKHVVRSLTNGQGHLEREPGNQRVSLFDSY